MTKTYDSYVQAALLNRARAARAEDNHLFCMDICIEAAIKERFDGVKYITPAGMALCLNCNTAELCAALEQHKRSIPREFILNGNYGNANYAVNYSDHVKLQGWINFLSLPCFSDSREAAKVVEFLKEA